MALKENHPMRKLIFNLHLYGALIAGIFVVIIGVTGSIMAFEEDIDRLMHPGLFHVEAQGSPLSASELFKAAQTAFPGQRIGTIRLPERPTDAAKFSVKGGRGVSMNPYTGAILGDRDGVTVLSKIHQLHLRLLLTSTRESAQVGSNIVASATAVLLFLVLSGIYLWWPVKRASINWSANARRIHFDLHNTAGIYSAAFLLVLGVTGIAIHFDNDIETYLHHRAGTQKIGKNTPSVPQNGARPITPDQALQSALTTLPGTRASTISIPGGPKGSYLVSLHYPEDLTPGGRSWANVDQFSGKVLSFQDSRTVATGTRVIILNRATHTGDLYGYPTKILMSLSSMMLVIQAITGYYMWWKKLRVRQSREELAKAIA
jgi:uncharacterized iron-regulated membrane protein